MKTTVTVPALDIDKVLYPDTNGKPHARGIRERRIVANLISYLQDAGFALTEVYDGEDFCRVGTLKEAMEIIFNLDEAVLYVRKPGFGYTDHSIDLVLGNDLDIISDYSYSEGDRDGFQAAMEAFNVEDFA